MTNKKYSFFISSTFVDLKDEKNIILEADNGLEYSYNKDEKKLKSLSIMKGYITDCIIMPRSHESDLEYWKY